MRKAGKNLMTMLMVLCLILSSIVSVRAYEPEPMSDLPSTHWAYASVMNMVRLEVISGYPDGTFKPDQKVSREEFAKMLCGATNLPLSDPRGNTFGDVTKDHWAFKYVETVKDYLTGYPSSSGKPLFKGREDATREDIAVALVKIKGFDKTVPANPNIINDMFKDAYTISSGLKNLVAIAVEKKLIEGFPDHTIAGTEALTRAQAAVIIDRANRIAGDIKGSLNDSDRYDSKKAELVYLTIDCSNTVGYVGQKLQASAKGFYTNGQSRDISTDVEWKSSNRAILTISDTGEIYLRKSGTAKISAFLNQKADEFDIVVLPANTGSSNGLKIVKVLPASKELKANETYTLKAEAVYENGKVVDVTANSRWESSDNSIAFVSGNGKVTGRKEGIVLLKATYNNTIGYSALSVVESVYTPTIPGQAVGLDSIALSHAYKELGEGQGAEVRVIANYSDNSKHDITALVQWSTDKPQVAVITQEGKILAISEGIAQITAAKDGKSCYMYVIVKKLH